MSQNSNTAPNLSELLSRYLERQHEASAQGLTAVEGDVIPFEAVPVQPVEPRLAWDEARAALDFFRKGATAGSTPPDWPTLVAGQEPAFAVALAAGNYPQLVRDLHRLLQARSPSLLQPAGGRPVAASSLPGWAGGDHPFPETLLAVGTLRLARYFDDAQELVDRHADEVPAEWRDAWENERAALAWHQGRAREAHDLWCRMPDSAPVLFNRGMSALFLDRPKDARTWLNKAVAEIPETSAWHHLGRLYLALAEMK
ncbi:MAG: hypothetical protein AB7K24_11615 [Gemmataceae bacterium]